MNNIYVKNGLSLGAVLVIVATLLHAIDPKLFLNWSSGIGYFFILFFMFKSAIDMRKSEGGILPFAEAFIAALIPMTIGVFISSVFTYVLHNWINPDLTLIVKEIAIETTEMLAEKISSVLDFKFDKEQALIELEKVDYSFGLGKMILAWVLTSLMGCIPALIVAAITKKGE